SAAAPAAAPATGPASVELLYGDFTEEDARARVAAFLDAGGGIDAIVAANDLMAFGAMSALAERGIDVPREVSVSGFDDNEDSRFTSPPLTTVRQPIAELGRIAVRRVASALGLIPPDSSDARLSVSFVLRRSCGCPYASEREYRDEEAQDGAPARPAPDFESLAAAIDAEIRAGRNPAELRGCAFPAESREAALLAIAEGECRYIEARRMAAERRYAVLGEIQSSLVSSFGMEDILRETARSTRELGVSGCRLCLFESKGPSPAWSRLMLASDTEGSRILAPYGLRFRTEELVPGGLPQEWGSYVCEPLRFGRESIGYLLCTADSADRRIYESLRDQVSSALKGAMLMAAERDRERDLERSVRARTSELSAANAQLVDEMARRKSLERELLEIANRLLGRIGQDIHDELCQDIAGLGIMAAVLEGKLRRAGAAPEAEEAAILAREAGRTAARAKDMARGLYPAELEAKGIVPAVSRLVEAARERSPAALRLEVTEGFALRDANKALQLYRIAQEALGNALRHSRAKEIKVGLYMDREYATVEVGDDGVGLPAYGGEEGGMGLHILKYRANVIGGELRIRSNEEGTTVSCRVPRLS
ncbi:MAG: substrate-binding domain-containing protein, partial [Spirochaetaceae bacterium]|nr:substrate-binding domain-containing protein [Spirochaetaceae bacterium]